MYNAITNSPVTQITADITDLDTTIPVGDVNVFPDAPSVATLGTGDNAETIKYTGKTATELTGCERGWDGIASSWNTGTSISRTLTAKEWNEIKSHIDKQVKDGDVHGLRINAGNLEYYDGTFWQIIEGGGGAAGSSPITLGSALQATAIKNTDTGSVKIYWKDPSDLYALNEFGQKVKILTWAGTRLVRKLGGYPTDENDGELLVDSTVRDQYSDIGFETTETDDYYYRLFPYTNTGIYSYQEGNKLEKTNEVLWIGVRWERKVNGIVNSSPELTRISNAIDFSDPVNNEVENSFDSSVQGDFEYRHYNFFDTVPGFNTKRVVIDKNTGEIVKDFDPDDPEFAGWTGANWENSSYDIMTKIPKFYYKVDIIQDADNTIWEWKVPLFNYSEGALSALGFELHPMFKHAESSGGAERILDYVLHSSFEGRTYSSQLRSIPFVSPTVSTTMTNFMTQARYNRSWGFQLPNMYTWSGLQMLFVIEFANLNSQNVLGQGISNASSDQSTGETYSMLKSGFSSIGTGGAHVNYRGVENPYGNIWRFYEGFLGNDGNTSTQSFGYDQNNLTDSFNYSYPSASSSYISDLTIQTPFGFQPSNVSGGGASVFFSDGLWTSTSLSRVARVGGHRTTGSIVGFFCSSVYNDVSISGSYVGSRLAFY